MDRQQHANSTDVGVAFAIILIVPIAALVVCLCAICCRYPDDQCEGADAPPAVATASQLQPQAPVVCTFSRADGWKDATCPVCLSDFSDGEALRVLPMCMHYFHEACAGEWLRLHSTCPLCRAAPQPP